MSAVLGGRGVDALGGVIGPGGSTLIVGPILPGMMHAHLLVAEAGRTPGQRRAKGRQLHAEEREQENEATEAGPVRHDDSV